MLQVNQGKERQLVSVPPDHVNEHAYCSTQRRTDCCGGGMEQETSPDDQLFCKTFSPSEQTP